jgi:hypothetical protein
MKDKTLKSLAVSRRSPYSHAPEGKTMAKHTGLQKLPNGRFRARYFAGYDSKGKRNYPAKTFDTQSEAIKWRAEQVSTKNPGRCFEGRGQTVAQYLDRWLTTKASP